tara:strand:- start:144 stop:374 length:231 start_codon:yes stop_codon:yes gene_type:complete
MMQIIVADVVIEECVRCLDIFFNGGSLNHESIAKAQLIDCKDKGFEIGGIVSVLCVVGGAPTTEWTNPSAIKTSAS